MTALLTPIAFRVQNFRKILDSGWIDLDDINVFVGLNESGKTSFLQALHAFNPWSGTPSGGYPIGRDFPRNHPDQPADDPDIDDSWPLCSIRFAIPETILQEHLDGVTPTFKSPTTCEITLHYSGSYTLDNAFEELNDRTISRVEAILANAIHELSRFIEPVDITEDDRQRIEDAQATLHEQRALLRQSFPNDVSLHTPEGVTYLQQKREQMASYPDLRTSDALATFDSAVAEIISALDQPSLIDVIRDKLLERMPACVYLEDYAW